MSVSKVVGLVAVLASLAACDEETAPEETAESQSQLSDEGGMGNDIPMPQVPDLGDPNDPDWQLPAPAPQQREYDLRDPGGGCGITYQTIYDPGRGRSIEVPVSKCQ